MSETKSWIVGITAFIICLGAVIAGALYDQHRQSARICAALLPMAHTHADTLTVYVAEPRCQP